MTASAERTSVALAPRDKILTTVEKYTEEIGHLAPRGMDAAHYIAGLRLHLAQNPKLLDCDPVSIAQGMLRVAQTGLVLGVSCDLLPFGKTCQYNARYNGIAELALQSGVRAINCDTVRTDDLLWEYQKGTELYLRHRSGPRKGAITHFYALAEMKPGSFVFEVLTFEEVDQIKTKYSKQWAKTPLSDIPWYGKKTAIRRLSPLLPKNPRFAAALQFEKEAEEVPEAEFEIMSNGNGAADHSEVSQASTTNEGPKGPASEAQIEKLLDLIEDPKISAADRERIEIKLKSGINWNTAALWIEEIERLLGAEP